MGRRIPEQPQIRQQFLERLTETVRQCPVAPRPRCLHRQRGRDVTGLRTPAANATESAGPDGTATRRKVRKKETVHATFFDKPQPTFQNCFQDVTSQKSPLHGAGSLQRKTYREIFPTNRPFFSTDSPEVSPGRPHFLRQNSLFHGPPDRTSGRQETSSIWKTSIYKHKAKRPGNRVFRRSRKSAPKYASHDPSA